MPPKSGVGKLCTGMLGELLLREVVPDGGGHLAAVALQAGQPVQGLHPGRRRALLVGRGRHSRRTLVGQPCWLVNMPTARVNCGIEPMKKADWDRLVVPVLAMISRPSGRPAFGAVPPGLVSKDSA